MQVHIECRGGGTRIFNKANGHLVRWLSWQVRQGQGDLPVAVIEVPDGPPITAPCSLSFEGDAAAVVPETKTPEEVARAVCDEMAARMKRAGFTTTIHYDAGLTLIADAVRSARSGA
jgi:hypothetical protein